MAAPQLLGNVGKVVQSQFQPFGFRSAVGTQFQNVQLRGPLTIDVMTALPHSEVGRTLFAPPVNSGLIRRSQFNGGGFLTVGLQFKNVRVGGGLTIRGFDNEAADVTGLAATVPATINRNLISNSQFSDGGFGTLILDARGAVIAREGRVGMQWRNTRIGGPVEIGLDDEIIQGEAAAVVGVVEPPDPGPSVTTFSSSPGSTVIDLTTNIGRIRNSQFNDGGFGDIGMQWSHVMVGGRVGTSTNTLFIKPNQDGFGPITIRNRTFGRPPLPSVSQASTGSAQSGLGASPGRVGARANGQVRALDTTYKNSTTNSGRIVRSQFNDGGFGDVGLQWRNVRVGKDVTAVHNSLTVQPENTGQALITVDHVRFPSSPEPLPSPAKEPARRLPANPTVVPIDGEIVFRDLPIPTGPLSPFFPTPFGGPGTVTLPFPGNAPLENSASNSGLMRSGQFNAGGFGDLGLQWRDVRVRGGVRLVHNSLSVHPEGSQLAGISVSDVAYGPPVSPRVSRRMAVLPYAVISAGPISDTAGRPVSEGDVLHPPNNRILANQQLADAGDTDVFLQWNGIEHRRGLVIVHNVIKLQGVGPNTGPITLKNIRFPFRVPTFAPLSSGNLRPIVTRRKSVPTVSAMASNRDEPSLINSANNSGIINHAQFSDGGFGDDGLQWRRVDVLGSVEVVHNTLSVDASSDLPIGEVSGPLTISNITFNSGALKGGMSRDRNQILVTPPDVFMRSATRPPSLGKPLPLSKVVKNGATNGGVLNGGQLEAGGANHTLLQWQCVRVKGKVRVIDNILAISVKDRPSGPITISDVTFA